MPAPNKWNSGVRRLITAGHDVIALQEAGQVPASAGHLDAQGNMVAGPVQTFPSYQFNGRTYSVREYEWRPNGTRGGLWYIYFLQTDFGANRVDLAIVTSHLADAVNVARPVFQGSRPALGVRFNNTYFWTVHAMSGGGNDARALLEQIDADSGTRMWAAMGDFNREPHLLTVDQNMHIYRTGTPTRNLAESQPSTLTVAADGSAQSRTVQAAIDAVPTDGLPHTIVINKGTYNEVIVVPKGLSGLTIKGATGKRRTSSSNSTGPTVISSPTARSTAPRAAPWPVSRRPT